jgi:mannose-6-phosphate isomerase-like protein (cupin superfamily)
MHTSFLKTSPTNHRGGQTSYLLLANGQFGSRELAVTWVECPPRSEQPVHAHDGNEQVYVIVRGSGTMTVDDEAREVHAGTLVFVPPRTGHSIRNDGHEPLVYISATAPPFERPELGDVFWFEPAVPVPAVT